MMTSYELVNILSKFTWVGDEEGLLGELLELCRINYSEVEDEFLAIVAKEGKVSSGTIDNVRTGLINARAVNIKRAVGSRGVFADIERLEQELMNISRVLDIPNYTLLGYMHTRVRIFSSMYEQFLHDTTLENTLMMLRRGSQLRSDLQTLFATLRTISYQLKPEEVAPNLQYAELSILLSSITNYDDVVAKLSDLGEIYSELCNLLGVSTSEYSLEVRKIESSSLWVSVLGNALIIGFIISLIKSAISFIHRNYTIEGKIMSLPREIEAADRVLQFTNKLQEAGMDVASSRENVQKTLFNISSKLNDLVANQPSVEVNGETFSVGEALNEKYLQESKRLLLEDGTQDTEKNKQ